MKLVSRWTSYVQTQLAGEEELQLVFIVRDMPDKLLNQSYRTLCMVICHSYVADDFLSFDEVISAGPGFWIMDQKV